LKPWATRAFGEQVRSPTRPRRATTKVNGREHGRRNRRRGHTLAGSRARDTLVNRALCSPHCEYGEEARDMRERRGLTGCLMVIVIIALIIGGAMLFTSLGGG
jgi:hypothetical protein